ncbi:DUF1127 domain-containing protein [Devosia sp. SD17-2]|jgi:transcription elongation GreA/GreB family factor/uncharacterized protein YjiS (DUF1127 family)|uniref:DUF1127 domain-containing protein n=1 Tax=Devosia sp. SD17-2 TaxID=2976459 RepID=UPI0023D8822C|nr:DUF1127 domain-containing protein [Devosia sp. SD17-2]WEJ35054.1 DUF1127 domain-containing protein [Devosia sp. SD17-2]
MQINHPTTLTLDDHAQLEQLMCTLTGRRDDFAALVRRKLESAVIIRPEDADDHLVTSGRHVRYRVNGEGAKEHVISWNLAPTGGVSTLSLQDSRGLALLGLRVGQSMSLPMDTGRMTIKVENVALTHGRAPVEGNSPSLPLRAESLGSTLEFAGRRFLRTLKHGFARMQKGRTESVLLRLSDATLRDIGITRGEIPHVAGIVAGLVPASDHGKGSAPRKRRRNSVTSRSRPLTHSVREQRVTMARTKDNGNTSVDAVNANARQHARP